MVLAFDYRGWGESDGRLVVVDDMPERDEDGVVHVSAREIRRVIDPVDQTLDIRRAFDFIEGEPNFDRHRAGELAIMRAQANGARAEYRVIPGITHYDIYRGAFDESAEMAREWFNGCLKD